MKPPDPESPHSSPSPADEDVSLVTRMAAGDEAALAELYDRWGSRLYSVALQILKAPDRAEDVLEETLWQAWRGAGSYSLARKTVATWLLTMARRKSLERVRARPRALGAVVDTGYGPPDPSFGAGDQLVPGAEHAALLERALRDLSDGERVAVELAYFHGYSQLEIAEATDQPLGTVRTNLRLGVQKLRQETGRVISLGATR